MDESHEPTPSAPQTDDQQGVSPRDAERASLRSLRDHVARAVEEIVRLRAQNKSLARRLAEYDAAGNGPSLHLDEGVNVDDLKKRIASFISSIDNYLGETEDADSR